MFVDLVQAKWTCMLPVPCSIQALSEDVQPHRITNLLLVLGKRHKDDQWSVTCAACSCITLILAVMQFMFLFKYLDCISITNSTKEFDNNCKRFYFLNIVLLFF